MKRARYTSRGRARLLRLSRSGEFIWNISSARGTLAAGRIKTYYSRTLQRTIRAKDNIFLTIFQLKVELEHGTGRDLSARIAYGNEAAGFTYDDERYSVNVTHFCTHPRVPRRDSAVLRGGKRKQVDYCWRSREQRAERERERAHYQTRR